MIRYFMGVMCCLLLGADCACKKGPASTIAFCGESWPVETDGVACHGEPVTNLRPLQRLDRIERLYLEKVPVSDLRPLANLTTLETLQLYGTQVSNLSPLETLTSLEYLGLAYTRVSDLRPIAKLENLETLDLRSTKASDLGALRELSKLEVLDLSDTLVVDVEPLFKLPSLRVLSLAGTSVSASQIEALQKQLPALKIERPLQKSQLETALPNVEDPSDLFALFPNHSEKVIGKRLQGIWWVEDEIWEFSDSNVFWEERRGILRVAAPCKIGVEEDATLHGLEAVATNFRALAFDGDVLYLGDLEAGLRHHDLTLVCAHGGYYLHRGRECARYDDDREVLTRHPASCSYETRDGDSVFVVTSETHGENVFRVRGSALTAQFARPAVLVKSRSEAEEKRRRWLVAPSIEPLNGFDSTELLSGLEGSWVIRTRSGFIQAWKIEEGMATVYDAEQGITTTQSIDMVSPCLLTHRVGDATSTVVVALDKGYLYSGPRNIGIEYRGEAHICGGHDGDDVFQVNGGECVRYHRTLEWRLSDVSCSENGNELIVNEDERTDFSMARHGSLYLPSLIVPEDANSIEGIRSKRYQSFDEAKKVAARLVRELRSVGN